MDMETIDALTAAKAKKNVVIVSAARKDPTSGDYKLLGICSGFVALNSKDHTYIVTSKNFVEGQVEYLSVCFFDGARKTASVVATGDDAFCLIRTDLHCDCEILTGVNGPIGPSRALTFPPYSSTEFHTLPCFIMSECLDAYDPQTKGHIDGSEKYMQVSCHYGDNSQLIAAPIFSMTGDGLGLFVGECRPEGNTPEEVGSPESNTPEEVGSPESNIVNKVIKLALSIRYICDILDPLFDKLDGDRVELKRSDASKTEVGGVECSSKNESSANKRKRDGEEGTSEHKQDGREVTAMTQVLHTSD